MSISKKMQKIISAKNIAMVLFVVGFFFAQNALAQLIGPTANPPAGNTSTPLNVSSNAQIKSGDLQVNKITSSHIQTRAGGTQATPGWVLTNVGNGLGNWAPLPSVTLPAWMTSATNGQTLRWNQSLNGGAGDWESNSNIYNDPSVGGNVGIAGVPVPGGYKLQVLGDTDVTGLTRTGMLFSTSNVFATNSVIGDRVMSRKQGFFNTDADPGASLVVGGSLADPSAIVDIKAIMNNKSAKGFLPPRVTTIQRNGIVSPADGLTVYDISLNQYFFYDSGNTPGWTPIGGINPSAMVNAGTAPHQTLRWDDVAGSWVPDSNLFNNGTRVGIGTTSPSPLVKLDVIGSASVSGRFYGLGDALFNKDVSVFNKIAIDKLGTATEGSLVIGAPSADPSSLVDFQSSTKGILIPRMSGQQILSIPSPAQGLLVYDTGVNAYKYNSATSGGIPNWVALVGGGSAVPQGLSNGETLYWKNGQWNTSSNLKNDYPLGSITVGESFFNNLGSATINIGSQDRYIQGTNSINIPSDQNIPNIFTSTGVLIGDRGLSVTGKESALNGRNASIAINNSAKGGQAWILRSGAGLTNTPIGGFSIADDQDNYRFVIDKKGKVSLNSTTGGFLPQRMTQQQRDAIVAPDNGLIVYNINNNKYQYFDSVIGTWVSLNAGGALVASSSQDRTLRWDNGQWVGSGNLVNDGTNVGVGIASPVEKLDVGGNLSVTGTSSTNSDLYLNSGSRPTIYPYGPNVVSAGGNVGLQVRSAGSAPLQLNGDNSGHILMNQGGGATGIGPNVDDLLPKAIAGTFPFTIPNPNLKLYVNGGAIVESYVSTLDIFTNYTNANNICLGGDCINAWSQVKPASNLLMPVGGNIGETLYFNGSIWINDNKIFNNGTHFGFGTNNNFFDKDLSTPGLQPYMLQIGDQVAGDGSLRISGNNNNTVFKPALSVAGSSFLGGNSAIFGDLSVGYCISQSCVGKLDVSGNTILKGKVDIGSPSYHWAKLNINGSMRLEAPSGNADIILDSMNPAIYITKNNSNLMLGSGPGSSKIKLNGDAVVIDNSANVFVQKLKHNYSSGAGTKQLPVCAEQNGNLVLCKADATHYYFKGGDEGSFTVGSIPAEVTVVICAAGGGGGGGGVGKGAYSVAGIWLGAGGGGGGAGECTTLVANVGANTNFIYSAGTGGGKGMGGSWVDGGSADGATGDRGLDSLFTSSDGVFNLKLKGGEGGRGGLSPGSGAGDASPGGVGYFSGGIGSNADKVGDDYASGGGGGGGAPERAGYNGGGVEVDTAGQPTGGEASASVAGAGGAVEKGVGVTGCQSFNNRGGKGQKKFANGENAPSLPSYVVACGGGGGGGGYDTTGGGDDTDGGNGADGAGGYIDVYIKGI